MFSLQPRDHVIGWDMKMTSHPIKHLGSPNLAMIGLHGKLLHAAGQATAAYHSVSVTVDSVFIHILQRQPPYAVTNSMWTHFYDPVQWPV